MLYHRDSALHKLRFPLESRLTGKPMAQLVNEVDGVGNPKGRVYSRSEMTELLQAFQVDQIFAGLLNSWMVTPRAARLIPDRWLRPLARRWGWFLYAKATKLG
jgi:hypothetical protein